MYKIYYYFRGGDRSDCLVASFRERADAIAWLAEQGTDRLPFRITHTVDTCECGNEARYIVNDDDYPIYCGLCDMLKNEGKGVRASDFQNAK